MVPGEHGGFLHTNWERQRMLAAFHRHCYFDLFVLLMCSLDRAAWRVHSVAENSKRSRLAPATMGPLPKFAVIRNYELPGK